MGDRGGIPFDLVLPSRDRINRVIEESDCVFEEGSRSMDEYPGELFRVPVRIRQEGGYFYATGF